MPPPAARGGDLPERFGNWHSVYVRFSRWERYGKWDRMAETLRAEADLEELFIDSTVVRTHQHAAGAQKNRGDQALSRSRGGLSAKIHAGVDALGNPLQVRFTGRQVADIDQASALSIG